jgi:HD-GYP domain-containing protein (c-di-GMP phosphodiesterase class II)
MDIKKEKIESSALQPGMYVTELDRPWIDSPFLLQGFVLEDPQDIDLMKTMCAYVFIDRTKSIGPHYRAELKHDVAIKREGAVVRIKAPKSVTPEKDTPAMSKARRGEKVSFLDIMRDLKNIQLADQGETTPENSVIYNVRHVADTVEQVRIHPAANGTHSKDNSPATGSLLEGVSGFMLGLFKREKLKTNIQYNDGYSADESAANDAYKVSIYHDDTPVENEIAAVFPVYEQSQIATRDIFDAVANEQQIDISAVSEVLDSMVESIGKTPDALLWLAKLKQTDNYAYNHALNVSINLMAFCNFLALSKTQIKHSGLAGLLQDIGKVKLSPDILLKAGKLTREEFEHAKLHVEESIKILRNSPDIPSEVISLVARHHERTDGSGYPRGLSDNELDLASQASGLIDTYCALTAHKSYAKALFHQQALDEIHHLADIQFRSELINQFIQFMGMYPVSSLVELNTGEVGVVIQQNQVRRLQPRIMLLLDQNKERYKSPVFLNLLHEPNTPSGDLYKITKSLIPNSYGLNPDDFFQ